MVESRQVNEILWLLNSPQNNLLYLTKQQRLASDLTFTKQMLLRPVMLNKNLQLQIGRERKMPNVVRLKKQLR